MHLQAKKPSASTIDGNATSRRSAAKNWKSSIIQTRIRQAERT